MVDFEEELVKFLTWIKVDSRSYWISMQMAHFLPQCGRFDMDILSSTD